MSMQYICIDRSVRQMRPKWLKKFFTLCFFYDKVIVSEINALKGASYYDQD